MTRPRSFRPSPSFATASVVWFLALCLGGCFVGVTFEKSDDEVLPCTTPTPGSCDVGATVLLNGANTVEVTDMARVGTTGNNTVVVGRFSGTFIAPGGPQLSAGAGTDGFLLELDGAGNYVAHLVMPEADETSVLRVSVHPTSTDVVVAGKYSQGPAGDCLSKTGIFVRRLAFSAPDSFVSSFPNSTEVVCVPATDDAAVNVNGVGVYPETPFITVVGSYNGGLNGAVSQGLDGYAISINEDGTIGDSFLLTGSGEAEVDAAMPSAPNNEWLVAGHFSGTMDFAVPSDPQTRTAQSGNDLFVISYDGFVGNPNLSVTTFASSGGAHRVTGLSFDPASPGQAVMVATLDGPITIAGTLVNGVGGPAVLALTFEVPIDSTSTPFAVVDEHILRGDIVGRPLVAGDATQFYLAAEATGPVTIERAGSTIGEIGALGCQRDAFMLQVAGPTVVVPPRCGDGMQALSAISSRQSGAAMAINVPPGASLSTSLGNTTVDTGTDAFIVFQ